MSREGPDVVANLTADITGPNLKMYVDFDFEPTAIHIAVVDFFPAPQALGILVQAVSDVVHDFAPFFDA